MSDTMRSLNEALARKNKQLRVVQQIMRDPTEAAWNLLQVLEIGEACATWIVGEPTRFEVEQMPNALNAIREVLRIAEKLNNEEKS